ncbi:MAG: DUF1549 domain-containing protein [Planctomycetaceae bacterium]
MAGDTQGRLQLLTAESVGCVAKTVLACFRLVFVLITATETAWAVDDAAEILFGRDVLPILSDRCFHCHGPDESHREADLRLDVRDEALRDRAGTSAIRVGDPRSSELIQRVRSTDEATVMPPPDSHRKALTAEEIRILETWIQQGAVWGKHWSFELPQKSALPGRKGQGPQSLNPVDAFVGDRLRREGLAFSPPADPHVLRRRLAFDLTGLPPRADLSDGTTTEAFIDELLKSPHYGERMAMWWLDAARYSDTDGYQADATRSNWPWRDWVIGAFNQNMPFDQFTIEQFAGDLLPGPTAEQILATCFHRNHMTNGEGGRDPEESRVDYVIDRTNTIGTVWLGLTLGCCQCHSHKFDPVSQHDYYRLSAFFNSIDEDGKAGGGAKPFMKYKSPYADRAVSEAAGIADERRRWEQEARQKALKQFESWLELQIDSVRQDSFVPWHALHPQALDSTEGSLLRLAGESIVEATGPNPFQDDYRIIGRTDLRRVTGIRLEVFPENSKRGTLSRGSTGQFILTDVKLQIRRMGSNQLTDVEFDNAVATHEIPAKGRAYGRVKDTLDDDPRNGWMVDADEIRNPQTAVFALKQPLEIPADAELVFVMLQRSTDGDANIGRFRVSVSDQPGAAVRSLNEMPLAELARLKPSDSSEISPQLRDRLLAQYLSDHAHYQHYVSLAERADQQLAECRKASESLNVMVLAEREKKRKTFVLNRGVWDAHADEVAAGFPDVFQVHPSDTNAAGNSAAELSRLELGRWIVSRQNPLTARVVVNHLWQMLFGYGLRELLMTLAFRGNVRPIRSYWTGWPLNSWNTTGISIISYG